MVAPRSLWLQELLPSEQKKQQRQQQPG